MNRMVIALLSVLLLTVTANASELKIAYVDLNRALNEAEEGKKAVMQLEEIVKSRQTEINNKGEEIKKLDDEIAKQSSVLNPDAIKEKKDEREKLMRDYQRMIKDSQDEVQKKQAEFMQDIIRRLRAVIYNIGSEGGYTAIFESAEGGLLYFDNKLDLTGKVIETFNASKSETKK